MGTAFSCCSRIAPFTIMVAMLQSLAALCLVVSGALGQSAASTYVQPNVPTGKRRGLLI